MAHPLWSFGPGAYIRFRKTRHRVTWLLFLLPGWTTVQIKYVNHKQSEPGVKRLIAICKAVVLEIVIEG